MTKASKTNLLILLVILNQIFWSFLWSVLPFHHYSNAAQTAVLYFLCFLVPIVLYFLITKASFKEIVWWNPINLKSVIAIFFFSFAIQPFMSFFSVLSSFLFPNVAAQAFQQIYAEPVWASLLSIALIPAVFEEILYRGIVFSGFKNTTLLKACLMSGLLFGMMHLTGQQFLYAFLLGSIFCYLVWRTKSIFASMICHFLINGSQFLLSLWANTYLQQAGIEIEQTVPTVTDTFFALLSTIPLMLLMLPLLILSIWLLNKANPIKQKIAIDVPEDTILIETEETLDYNPLPGCEEKVFNIPLIVLLIIYFCFVLLPYILLFFLEPYLPHTL